MPHVSTLEILGTLPVPELQTVLTVHLINLEHSQETNLVYTSSDALSPDAFPPAHLRFGCLSKSGDLLIWASPSRWIGTHSVRACWVFDGAIWAKVYHNSGFITDHPGHPQYRLVILPGPDVNWKLKTSDPERELSRTFLEGLPFACAGTGGTVSTHVKGNSSLDEPTESHPEWLHDLSYENAETAAMGYNQPTNHETKSPESQRTQSPNWHGIFSAALDCDISISSPSNIQSEGPHPNDRHSPTYPISESLSEICHLVPPLTPLTHGSTMHSSVRNRAGSLSSPIPSPRKRPRSSGHAYSWPAFQTSSSLEEQSPQVEPSSVTRRRRLDGGCLPVSRSAHLETDSPVDMQDRPDAGEVHDSEHNPTGDIATPGRQDASFTQLLEQQGTMLCFQPKPPLEYREGQTVEITGQMGNIATHSQNDVFYVQSPEKEWPYTAVLPAQQPHAYTAGSAILVKGSGKETDSNLQTVQGEKDRVLLAFDDLERAEEDVRNPRRESDDLDSTCVNELRSFEHWPSFLEKARYTLDAQITSARLELETFTQAHQRQLDSFTKTHEETKQKLEEQTRRAANFEESLREAQEGLQLQQTLSQSVAARQNDTIAQLATESQERGESIKELERKIISLEGLITKLEASLSESQLKLVGEEDNVRRANDELEQLEKTAQNNRIEMERLRCAKMDTEHQLDATQKKKLALDLRIEEMQQKASAQEAALAKANDGRLEAERRSQEFQVSADLVEQSRSIAESGLRDEIALRKTAESQLSSQRIHFDEHLCLVDRERGRMEQLLIEQRLSFEQDLRAMGQKFELAQAECRDLKAQRRHEHERYDVVIFPDLNKAIQKEKRLREKLSIRTQEVEEARWDCATMKSIHALESHRLNNEISSLGLKIANDESELSSVRTRCARSEEQLATAQQERARIEETLANERSSFSLELEQLVSSFTSMQEELSSLRKRCLDIESQSEQLQESLDQEQVSNEVVGPDIEEECFLQKMAYLEEQLSAAEVRRTRLEEHFSEERARAELQLDDASSQLESERANCARIIAQLSDERQRVQDLSTSLITLEQELATSRSELAVVNERVKALEAEQAERRQQDSAVSSDLETAEQECVRLKADLSSNCDRLKAEETTPSDNWKRRLASLESRLDQERKIIQTLRKELASKESSTYWSDLSSQLLHSLHEAQDRLREEQAARQKLEYAVAGGDIEVEVSKCVTSMRKPKLPGPN